MRIDASASTPTPSRCPDSSRMPESSSIQSCSRSQSVTSSQTTLGGPSSSEWSSISTGLTRSSRQEAEAHPPLRVVRVRVDEDERLPRAERHPSADYRYDD